MHFAFPPPEDLLRDGQALANRLHAEFADDAAAAVVAAFAHGQAVVFNRVHARRTCRVCGCWELAACEGGCSWVAQDLCSACQPHADTAAEASLLES